MFQYYRYWFILTVLTLPGAAIAFLLKRKDWLSVAVLSVATGYLAYASVDYFYTAMARFPHHIISAVFCLTLAVFFVFVLLDEKKHRLAALAIIAAVLIFCAIVFKPISTQELVLGDGEWTCSVDDESVATVEITGDRAVIHAEGEGNTLMVFTNSDGEVEEYDVSVSGGGIFTSAIG